MAAGSAGDEQKTSAMERSRARFTADGIIEIHNNGAEQRNTGREMPRLP